MTCPHHPRRVDETGLCELCGDLTVKQAITVRPVAVPEGRFWFPAKQARNRTETGLGRVGGSFAVDSALEHPVFTFKGHRD